MLTSPSGPFTPVKEAPQYPPNMMLTGPQNQSEGFREGKFCFLSKNEQPFLGHPSRILDPNTDPQLLYRAFHNVLRDYKHLL